MKAKTYFSKYVRDGRIIVYSWDRENFQVDFVDMDNLCNCIKSFTDLNKAIEYAENY